LAVKNRTEKVELWSKADAWGYDSLWVFDHFYPIFVPDPAGRAWRDGLCFPLSVSTQRARRTRQHFSIDDRRISSQVAHPGTVFWYKAAES
jgi:alkanesulfonate monooxygenase SsuD/methylene tetrahydromethanopterin reductase-like flavin-dependent oxidoreductase (luciferase family)